MKLHTVARAPNPRRVDMFLAEKGIHDIGRVEIDLNAGQHKAAVFLARNPLAKVPVLELDDGRFLAKSRAICSFLEARYPEPNLMGCDGDDRAFIEMADRQVEFSVFAIGANLIRHTHPGLAALEQPQFTDFGKSQDEKMLDSLLSGQTYVAGERFTIADITAFCTIESLRLVKFKPAATGLNHLAVWLGRIAVRPSAAM